MEPRLLTRLISFSFHTMDNENEKIIIAAPRKGFWISNECSTSFPRRVYPPRISERNNKVSTTILFVRVLASVIYKKPRVLILAQQHLIPLLLFFRKRGLFKDIQLVAICQHLYADALTKYLDKIVVYCTSEVFLHDPSIRSKYVFVPLPAEGESNVISKANIENYIISGGSAARDYPTLLQAVRGLDVRCIIVAGDSPLHGPDKSIPTIPENCTVLKTIPEQDFLGLLASSLFVIVPLLEGYYPHGHTTIVQAKQLGKAVITMKDSSCDDYVTDTFDGLLVPPGDPVSLRNAIVKLLNNPSLCHQFEINTKLSIDQFTYKNFARSLQDICDELL